MKFASSTDRPTIDIYPVGLLSDLRHLRGAWRRIALDGKPVFSRMLRSYFRSHVWRPLRDRRWHYLKTYLNGYLAESNPFPEGVTRCGSGWTKARAMRSLRRQYEKAGVEWVDAA